MAKKLVLTVGTGLRTKDSSAIDYRKQRWGSIQLALDGIPVNSYTTPQGEFIPGRYTGLKVPVIVGGRTEFYWWESDTSNAGFVPYLGRIREYVDNSIISLQNDLEAQINDITSNINNNLLHKTGDETKDGKLTLLVPPKVPTGVADTDAVNLLQLLNMPNDIRFQRINRMIPRIRVTASNYNKCKDFLMLVPANNYAHVKISVVDANSTVKSFEFMSGYDALSTSSWSRLTPLQVYNDRGNDFNLEIRKVPGFGPLNFGIIFRIHSAAPGRGVDCVVKLDFALELPAVGVNYDQFAALNTPEYDWNGINGLYGIKLTQTGDGRNFTDDQGQLFVKNGSQLILDLQNYKADTSFVNAQIQILSEDIENIEEVLLPLKQDKEQANSSYNELLERILFLQTQIDAIPDTFELTAEVVAKLPLVNSQEELDAIPEGKPYRAQGFIKYKVADSVFGYEFDDTFGGDAEGTTTGYNGIFSEVFAEPFEL